MTNVISINAKLPDHFEHNGYIFYKTSEESFRKRVPFTPNSSVKISKEVYTEEYKKLIKQ